MYFFLPWFAKSGGANCGFFQIENIRSKWSPIQNESRLDNPAEVLLLFFRNFVLPKVNEKLLFRNFLLFPVKKIFGTRRMQFLEHRRNFFAQVGKKLLGR